MREELSIFEKTTKKIIDEKDEGEKELRNKIVSFGSSCRSCDVKIEFK